VPALDWHPRAQGVAGVSALTRKSSGLAAARAERSAPRASPMASCLLPMRIVTSVRRPTVTILTWLAVATTAVAAGGPPAPRPRGESLRLRGGAAAAVELGLWQAAEPAVHRLASPPRVYADLAGATLDPRVARSIDGTGAVRRVRVGQFDASTVRVVV